MCRHLRDLLRDADRDELLFHEHNKIIADFSRQRVTKKTLEVGHLRPPSSCYQWSILLCPRSTMLTCNEVSCAACMQLLSNLADRAKLREKIDAMFNGEHINVTEDRAVLHVALRAPRHKVL